MATSEDRLSHLLDRLPAQTVTVAATFDAPAGRVTEMTLTRAQLAELVRRSQEEAEADLACLRAAATAIYQSFLIESANGVVCSIPDTGIDTPPHRLWCARCQALYRKLRDLGSKR